ncbi:MAG: DegV domain-containing protein [Chloroflexi bacterium ADurb.Bin325]|nr:MAG: DegV domain-containing protein [Chloroflexi bacterium ADurb.Bin325]
MAQVKIVTDSSAHLPDMALVAEYGIEVIPLLVRVGSQVYPERINQTDEALLRRMLQDPKSVTVDAPALNQVQALFARLGQVTDSVICIHGSGALHDTGEIVRRAAAGFMGRQRIVVLDTLTTSIGLGLIVEAAARAAATGASQAEIVRIVRGMIPHIYALFFSDSLEYLEAWGRLGPAQTMLGTMLDLKPLSMMEDGDFVPIEKVRSYARAVDKLHDFIIEFSRIEQLYLVQHGFETEAAQLLERLELTFPRREFPVIDYSPSLAVHVGPRALGVMVYEGVR